MLKLPASPSWFGVCFVAFFAISVLLLSWLAAKDRREWRQFKATHNCRIVGKVDGLPDKTGWQCDDGITYWR